VKLEPSFLNEMAQVFC